MTFFSTSEKLEIGGVPFVSIASKPTRNEALEYYRRVAIKEQLNIKDGPINIMTNSGTFEEGNDVLPKNILFEIGVSDVFKEGDYYFATNVKKVIQAGPKTLDECKGKVINDYQQFLEENWVKDLKSEFIVEVNQAVFESVKKQLRP